MAQFYSWTERRRPPLLFSNEFIDPVRQSVRFNLSSGKQESWFIISRRFFCVYSVFDILSGRSNNEALFTDVFLIECYLRKSLFFLKLIFLALTAFFRVKCSIDADTWRHARTNNPLRSKRSTLHIRASKYDWLSQSENERCIACQLADAHITLLCIKARAHRKYRVGKRPRAQYVAVKCE